MSGLEAGRQVLEEAQREMFVSADLVARALRVSRRQLLRDWHRRKLTGHTRVGQQHRLPSSLVLSTYFNQSTSNQSTSGESHQN